MIKVIEQTGLDKEWVELLREAKSIGISVEEVRLFFKETQSDENLNR